MNFVDVLRHRQGQPASGGAGDDRAGQHVPGYLVQAGGQAQYLVRVHPLTGGDHVGQDRVPPGQRAGLVEQHDLTAGQPFQGATALDDHPGLRGPAQAGHDRDRGGQQQRARCRDHQHGDGPHCVPAQRPARPREDERERHEGDREPVGGANERSRGSLGLLDQAHHPGVGGLGGHCRGDQVDRLARVDHTASDIVAGEPLDRQRLPGQGRLVQHARWREAVHQPGRSARCPPAAGHRRRPGQPGSPRPHPARAVEQCAAPARPAGSAHAGPARRPGPPEADRWPASP